jgi:hypothetical protein
VNASTFSTIRATRSRSIAWTTSSTRTARTSSFSASGPTRSAARPTCSSRRSMPGALSLSAREKVSTFCTVRPIEPSLSSISRPTFSSTSSARRAMLRADSSRSWKSDWSAKIVGIGWPGPATRGGAPGSPPISAICATPVRPWYSRRARVSVRTGVARSSSTTETTRRGSSGRRLISVTSPTRRPLKSTAEPLDRPETEPEKTIRTCCRAWPRSPPENQYTNPKAAATTARVNRPISA